MDRSALALRPATDADQPFLLALLASTRPELSLLDDMQRAVLLQMQFNAQRSQYRQQYPLAVHSVVMAGAEPAGQMLVARSDAELRLVDLSLLPACRRRGMGGRLLADLQQQAAQAGLPLRLQVLHNNSARRLYLRMGFVPGLSEGVHEAMEWRATVNFIGEPT
jgi:ribosomal protein S18 acetylase RimI-like enzyme